MIYNNKYIFDHCPMFPVQNSYNFCHFLYESPRASSVKLFSHSPSSRNSSKVQRWVECVLLFIIVPFQPHHCICKWGHFEKPLKWETFARSNNLMIRGLKISDPIPDLQGRVRSWRLNSSPIVNDFITHAYVMKLIGDTRVRKF